MSKGVEDIQMLRLIRAFQKLTDRETRRSVVLYVEEQLQRQEAGLAEHSSKLPPEGRRGTTGDS
jgi:hypothetical protein